MFPAKYNDESIMSKRPSLMTTLQCVVKGYFSHLTIPVSFMLSSIVYGNVESQMNETQTTSDSVPVVGDKNHPLRLGCRIWENRTLRT